MKGLTGSSPMPRINAVSQKYMILTGLIVSAFLLVPSMVWIGMHRQPFPGDHSMHAIDSMNLYSAISDSLTEWLQEMRSVGYLRGPAISWIGQFFVGFGLAIGSVDFALLLSGVVIEILTLWALYIAILELSAGQVSVALMGAGMLSAAPKFIGAPHLFNIEPHQTLAVAWFVLVLAFTPKWSRAKVTGQLLLAGAFAVLAKSSTPIYVAVLAIAILYSAFFSQRKSGPGGWTETGTLITWGLGLLLLGASIVWYSKNWDFVFQHAFRSGFGPSADVWGMDTSYLNTLLFWLDELQKLYFQPLAMFILILMVFAGWRVYNTRHSLQAPIDHFTSVAILSTLQIIIVLLLFAFSPNRHTRFITPLLPYVVVITCWSVVEIGKRWIYVVLVLAAGFQLIIANAYSLNLIPYGSFFAHFTDVVYGGPFSRNPTNQNILDEIVIRTCDGGDPDNQLTIVAVDPALKGDWLAPVPALYTADKMYGVGHPCEFGYAGNSFWGAELEETWRDLITRDVSYFVTTDPDIYPPPPGAMNQSLSIENHPRLVDRIVNSGIFVELSSLKNDPGILLFKRVNSVGDGRSLLDRGEIDAGIETLEMVTELEPENPEAWANLTLAYVLAGRQDEALAAGARTLSLNPDHFYAHMMMASIYQGRAEYLVALAHLDEAVRAAPSDQEEVRALRALAESLTAMGEARRACLALADALGIDALPEITMEMSELDCESVIGGK